MRKIAVIGGGPAGMMAAYAATQAGNTVEVTLYETNRALGRKLALAGGTRCNITHTGSVPELAAHYHEAGKFLYSALYQLDNWGLCRFFTDYLGLNTQVEADGRIFPQAQSGEKVAERFHQLLQSQGVIIQTGHPIGSIRWTAPVFQVNDASFDAVILCTGGISYPRTGSAGFGLSIARSFGHQITPLLPGLAKIFIAEDWPKQLSGVSLADVELTSLAVSRGELLFTHFGLSGPAALNLSRWVAKSYTELGPNQIKMDLVPEWSWETTNTKLMSLAQEQPRVMVKNLLKSFLPEAVATVILRQAGLDPTSTGAQISKKAVVQLTNFLKGATLTVPELPSTDSGQITVGGVALTEVNPKTLESKVRPGLFFAGEILDLDGETGGYNIQAAFSTGYAAGQGAIA